jgi:cytochrome bd-type quinol oxidase subunit 2
MITIAEFFIPILFLFLYIVFYSFELAAVFQSWKPKRFGTGLFVGPIFEITNVFLVFALIGFIAFFPGTLLDLGSRLAIPAFIFLTIQAVRIGAMMDLVYEKKQSRFSKDILAIASILTPTILLGGTIPVFLFANTSSPAAILLSIAIGIFAACTTSITAILFLDARKNMHKKIRVWAWILFQAILWVLVPLLACLSHGSFAMVAKNATDTATARILLAICGLGFVATVPGIAIAYATFL